MLIISKSIQMNFKFLINVIHSRKHANRINAE